MSCSQSQVNDKASICQQCSEGYLYSSKINKCVYSLCQDGFYFQIDENYGSDSIGNCLSICDPFYKQDKEQNLCKRTLGCSSQFTSQQNFNGTQQSKGLFVYQDEYYVSLYNSYLSLFNRADLQLIKHLNYEQDDLNIQYLNGELYVLSNNNQVSLWSIISENRVYIFNSTQFLINSSTQLLLIQNNIVIIQFQINDSIYLQAIYDQQSNLPIMSNSIQIDLKGNQIQQQDGMIIQINNQIFSISLLSYSSQYNLQLQNNVITCDGSQQGSLLSILQITSPIRHFSIHQNGILDLNFQSNSCSQIFQHQGIQKVKALQSKNNEQNEIHLIVLASQNLIDYNLNTLSQQQINGRNKKIYDFEVGSFLNDINEIISLTDLQNLELYNLISSNQSFSLYYSVNSIVAITQQLMKIQTNYTNQLQDEFQQSFEVIFLSQEIQIVRKNFQIANELELKIIDNFVFPYPTPNSPINSMIIIDNAPLLLTCHINGDILFYDTSRGIDTKLIRRLQNFEDECFQIAQLSNNQAVAQMKNQILLINPLTQQVVKAVQNLNQFQFFSANTDKISAVYDDCLIILSQELSQLFNDCNNQLVQIQQAQSLDMGTIQTCEFHLNYAVFFSPQYIMLIDRLTLSVYQSIQAPQGLNMIKYLFVEALNQIVYSCDNPLFSQIYIWKCQVLVNSTNLLLTKQQITSIIPKQSISFSFQGQMLVNQADWQQTIYLLVSESQFYTLNNFLSSQSLQNSQVIISPQVQSSNNLYLDYNSFLAISQVNFYLNNFNLIFKASQNQNDTLIIALNKNIQSVVCTQQQQNSIDFALFQLFGCTSSYLFSFIIQNNFEIPILYTDSSYKQKKQVTSLTDDTFIFQNITSSFNSLQDSVLFKIKSSFAQIIQLNYTNNSGGFMFDSSNQPFISQGIIKSEVIAYSLLIFKIILTTIIQEQAITQTIIECIILFTDYVFLAILFLVVLIIKSYSRGYFAQLIQKFTSDGDLLDLTYTKQYIPKQIKVYLLWKREIKSQEKSQRKVENTLFNLISHTPKSNFSCFQKDLQSTYSNKSESRNDKIQSLCIDQDFVLESISEKFIEEQDPNKVKQYKFNTRSQNRQMQQSETISVSVSESENEIDIFE
ncbi:hypothetical protein ABPG74_020285 [Tetrahymena malaccensis]